MDPTRTEALLESVRAVQDSVSRLEREIMAALAEDGRRTSPPASSSNITDEWFTVAELGEWLKVSRTTAYELVSSRELPGYRIGRSIRVRRADVERWLEENHWEVGG